MSITRRGACAMGATPPIVRSLWRMAFELVSWALVRVAEAIVKCMMAPNTVLVGVPTEIAIQSWQVSLLENSACALN